MSPSTSQPSGELLRSARLRVLDHFEAFAALDRQEKRALADEIATELGVSFRAGTGLVGEAQLPTLVHVPSGLGGLTGRRSARSCQRHS